MLRLQDSRWWKLVAVLAAACFALPAVASAHARHHRGMWAAGSAFDGLSALWPPPTPDFVAVAEGVAAGYWGGMPCGGQVAIGYGLPTETATQATDGVAPPGSPLWAWTTFSTPLGPQDYAAAPSTFAACAITFNSQLWSPAQQGSVFPWFCTLMVHEFGHLYGHPDLPGISPGSITYPLINPALQQIPQCDQEYADGEWQPVVFTR